MAVRINPDGVRKCKWGGGGGEGEFFFLKAVAASYQQTENELVRRKYLPIQLTAEGWTRSNMISTSSDKLQASSLALPSRTSPS